MIELFATPGPDTTAVVKRFRVVRRAGELLLALPTSGVEAAVALDLYTPLKRAPQLAHRALRTWLRLGLPAPLAAEDVALAIDDEFGRFLSRLSPSWSAPENGLAVLAGNPRAAGRRFTLMLFDAHRPVAVVKAGASAEARRLIAHEAAFLRAAQRPGIALPRAEFDGENVAAFAMDPLSGAAPRRADAPAISLVLLPWLDTTRVPLQDVPGWARVAEGCAAREEWRNHCEELRARKVCPALTHGDFAPWNVKVHPVSGAWQVFDWERAEQRGVPGWDWLHFEIQSAILGRGECAPAVHDRLNRLFSAPQFRDYAERAGIVGVERPLTIAYLLRATVVQPQTEGATTLAALLQLLAER